MVLSVEVVDGPVGYAAFAAGLAAPVPRGGSPAKGAAGQRDRPPPPPLPPLSFGGPTTGGPVARVSSQSEPRIAPLARASSQGAPRSATGAV